MIGIPVGLATANAVEWAFHKYVLHGLGKNKDSFWSFHWHEHHRNVRRHGHGDPEYARDDWRTAGHGPAKEAIALWAAAVGLTPLFVIAPFFVGTLYYSAARYWHLHKKSHLDPEWAREHLPWHYDHHMGPEQDANWCVTRPWFDQLLGTRKPYVGTSRERARKPGC